VPDPAAVEVEEVGGDALASEAVLSRRSERQPAALAAAQEVGYDDDPREATTAGVADERNCATTTAAAHLGKTEAKLVSGLLGR